LSHFLTQPGKRPVGVDLPGVFARSQIVSYSCSDFLDDVMRCLVHSEAITEAEITDADPGTASDVATAAIVTMHRAALSSRFLLELLNAVESLDAIAAEHGVDAVAFLLYLQAAIFSGSCVGAHTGASESIIGLVARLPSAPAWMKHIRTETALA
jgi:hypothetical protein